MASSLVTIILQLFALLTLQEICGGEIPTERELDEFAAAVETFQLRTMMRRALQSEGCSQAIFVEWMSHGSKVAPWLEFATAAREDLVQGLETLLRFSALLDKDFFESNNAISELENQARSFPCFSRIMLPSVLRTWSVMYETIAMIRVTQVGLAALKFKSKRGALPAKLEDLVPSELKSLPSDPFTGRPLRYTNSRVYSIGLNGRDDGGDNKPPEKDDQTFEFK